MTVATITAIGVGSMNGDSPTTIGDNRVSFIPTGHFGTPQTNRGWLMFDISSIPKDAVVSSAVLKLTVSSNFLGASHDLHAYRLRRNPYKGTNTAGSNYPQHKGSWNNYRQDLGSAWTTAGAGDTTNDRFTSSGSVALTSASTGQISITLTAADIQAWIDGSVVNGGLLLQASDESGTTLMRWVTLDGAAASQPQLVVTYTSTIEGLALTDSLEAYYQLADTADATGNAHTLTLTGSPSFVTGRISQGLQLVRASGQYAQCADAALNLGNSDWTIACWVKLTDLAELYAILTSEGATLNGGFRLWYHKQSSIPYYVGQIHGAAGHAEVVDVVNYRGGLPVAGAWEFVAFRHDSVRNFGHIFRNAQSIPDSASGFSAGEQWGPYTNTPAASSAGLYIGRLDGGATEYANAVIDEVGIWTRWLSNTEIATLYNSGNGKTFNGTAFVDSEGSAIAAISHHYRQRRG